jgi:hypothetical protein
MAGEWTSIRSAIIKPGVGGKNLKTVKTKIAILSNLAILYVALTQILTLYSFHSSPCEVKV